MSKIFEFRISYLILLQISPDSARAVHAGTVGRHTAVAAEEVVVVVVVVVPHHLDLAVSVGCQADASIDDVWVWSLAHLPGSAQAGQQSDQRRGARSQNLKISVVTVLGPDSEKYCHFSNSVRSAKCSGRNVYMYSLEFCYWRKMSADFLLLLAPSQSGLGLASRKMLEKLCGF